MVWGQFTMQRRIGRQVGDEHGKPTPRQGVSAEIPEEVEAVDTLEVSLERARVFADVRYEAGDSPGLPMTCS